MLVQGYAITNDPRALHGNETAVSFSGRGAKAVVYKKCTVPKTAAITFVSRLHWLSTRKATGASGIGI